MTKTSTPRRAPDAMSVKDRRAAPGARSKGGFLRRLKRWLVRPIGLQRREGRLKLVLIDRRHAPSADQPPTLAQLCAELRVRLLEHENSQAAEVMRHLALVHDELGRSGWRGVEGLPGAVLGRALVQAQMLAGEEPSPAMSLLVERVLPLRVAAELREERRARTKAIETGELIEVSEATREEFEASERTWVSTSPPVHRPPHDDHK